MAIPVARVHLKVAHAALPALLPTPPMWKTMLPTPPGVAAMMLLPKPLAKPRRADSDERWDAHKTKSSASPSSAGSVKNATTAKPGRADSAGRWDAHKKAASPASSSTSSLVASSSTCAISRATSSSAERWDAHKKRCTPQSELLSSTGSNDIATNEEEEEILWKPRAMYAAPGFVGAAPKPSMLPMPPTSFLVPVA